MTARGWAMYEKIALSIPNPRSVVRMPIPPGLSPEQLARIEAEIDRINAEADRIMSVYPMAASFG